MTTSSVDGEEIPLSCHDEIASLMYKWTKDGLSHKQIYALLLTMACNVTIMNNPVGWREYMIEDVKSIKLIKRK